MTLKNRINSVVPSELWQFGGFCKRLPMYWRLDRSESLRVQRGLEGLPLFITRDIYVQIPENVTAYVNWRAHGIEDAASREEVRDFLKLSEGRSALIDIGAQTGSISAFFARSRTGPAHILSMEPDPQVQAILARARALNSPEGVNWEIRHEAVSDREGTIEMPISNTPFETERGMADFGKLISVPSRTLTNLVASLDWLPDLVKIDVESFEYEILTSSLPLIERIKPALQLEVHWEILKRRNLDAMDFLSPIAAMGYRGLRAHYRNPADWLAAGRKEAVSRLSLEIA
jgi:FkbM family methyltransferase